MIDGHRLIMVVEDPEWFHRMIDTHYTQFNRTPPPYAIKGKQIQFDVSYEQLPPGIRFHGLLILDYQDEPDMWMVQKNLLGMCHVLVSPNLAMQMIVEAEQFQSPFSYSR